MTRRSAGFSYPFETSRDVHAVTEDVPVFDHDMSTTGLR
jgi:hypothetical protein